MCPVAPAVAAPPVAAPPAVAPSPRPALKTRDALPARNGRRSVLNIYLHIFVLIWIVTSFTLYPAHSRVGRGNLVLRYPFPIFSIFFFRSPFFLFSVSHLYTTPWLASIFYSFILHFNFRKGFEIVLDWLNMQISHNKNLFYTALCLFPYSIIGNGILI